MNTDTELKELSIYLAKSSAAFILEFPELFTSQYEEFDGFGYEELHGACAEVMDAGQHVPDMFLWVFIKAWKILERYRRNQFKDDLALSGILVRHVGT